MSSSTQRSTIQIVLTGSLAALQSTSSSASLMNIRYSDSDLSAASFVALAQRVWPRDYDLARVQTALARTANITAWDADRLVGSVRILTDGYLFATVPEILVDPDYQRRGIGRHLMIRALEHAPRGKLFLGAQPEATGFFERLGCSRGPVGFVATSISGSSADAT
jgi:ribosomal protein S18 acetylase RimI-like enzyme